MKRKKNTNKFSQKTEKNKPVSIDKKAGNSGISSDKKRIFWIFTISFPFLILILLEIGLRIFEYGGNLDLFIEGPPGFEKYLRANPNVARRYFYVQSTIPNPPTQLFFREKPKNGYRIFVLGESSAMGFPYGNNASFPNILERGLSNTFLDKEIEVINISMSAINTYTLLDLLNEILDQSPDALLIYTGHNEYYGALGVGSVQTLGSSSWFIKTYLKLQSFKIFLLLRDFIGWIKNLTSNVLYEGTEADPTATMMERIVGEQTIPYGSELYRKGKEQFEKNMEAIVHTAIRHGVKVVLGELVSNIRDQAPFISLKDKQGNSAQELFNLARQLEKQGNFSEARKNYFKAKDLDALRFRSPEEFNFILKNLALKYFVPLAPTINNFEKKSPGGIIGNSLMIEHLHPNMKGYFLLAETFYETMKKNKLISQDWPKDGITAERDKGVTALDSVYASIVIGHLKESWPFKPKGLPNRFVQSFVAANKMEELSLKALVEENYNLVSAHYDLGKFYENKGELDSALSEYRAMISFIPHEPEFYQLAATILIKRKEYDKAAGLLHKSLKYKDNAFANKWIGQIAYINKNYSEAVRYLSKGDLNDPQVVFNLSRGYYMNKEWAKGEQFYERLKNLSPKSDYFKYLTGFRTSLKSSIINSQ
jgi:tetratricopeptide (TPR) repeat protein